MAATTDWVTLPTTAAAKAAARNWPSMLTLTTPARSHSTPHIAPKTSGVARVKVPANWLLTGKGRSRPEAAQVRNPSTTARPATTEASTASRPRTRLVRKPAPISTHTTAQTATVAKPGNGTVGSWTSSKASDKANRAVPDVAVKLITNSTPTIPISAPVESRCRRFATDSTALPAALVAAVRGAGSSLACGVCCTWSSGSVTRTVPPRVWGPARRPSGYGRTAGSG